MCGISGFALAYGLHLTGGLRSPLLVACATYRLRCAFPIRNSGCSPRGAYAPRSWLAMRRSAEAKTIFAMHKRTFSRAAIISPPWVREPAVVRQQPSTVRRTIESATKSGGRQPAVVRIRACNGDRLLRTDYVSLRTFASRTPAGLRQPLSVACAEAVANVRFRRATANLSHGWLTPAAPVCARTRLQMCGSRGGETGGAQ